MSDAAVGEHELVGCTHGVAQGDGNGFIAKGGVDRHFNGTALHALVDDVLPVANSEHLRSQGDIDAIVMNSAMHADREPTLSRERPNGQELRQARSNIDAWRPSEHGLGPGIVRVAYGDGRG